MNNVFHTVRARCFYSTPIGRAEATVQLCMVMLITFNLHSNVFMALPTRSEIVTMKGAWLHTMKGAWLHTMKGAWFMKGAWLHTMKGAWLHTMKGAWLHTMKGHGYTL